MTYSPGNRHLHLAGQSALRAFRRNWSKRGVRELLWEAQDGRCISCDTRLQRRDKHPNDGDRDTIEHVHPLQKGGADGLGNLALSHHKCNHLKANKLPNEAEISRLQEINAKLGWPNHTPDPYWWKDS
jgi:5-methylcytosine-specific restriction endonuclease McrA